MKAIQLKAFGDTENLVYTELPVPVPGEGEVLIQVKAISLNPVDVKTRSGKGLAGRLKELKPLILGWDISGFVVSAGKSATRFKPGDEVFGMVNFPGHEKAYAEYVSAPEVHLALKPAGISHEEAAAATLAALTAWQAIVHHANVKPGQKVLIHAAAGGVGHFAVQIAKHAGAYVIGTSSAGKKDFVLSLGADQHIDYTTNPSLKGIVSEIDFVLDTIGGDNIDKSLEVTKLGGTIISIPSGLNEAVTQKAKEKGVNGYFFLVQSDGKDIQDIAELLDKKVIVSHVSQVFEFDQMRDAHKAVETGHVTGKVVVKV